MSQLLQASYPARQLVFLSLSSDLNDPEGDETVWRCGKAVGNTTSGCYSPALGRSLAMAYLPPAFTVPGSRVQVELHGVRHEAEVLEGPPALTQPARERQEEERRRRKTVQQVN